VQIGACSPEHLMRLKHETRTTLIYASLAKRAELTPFAPAAPLAKVRWKILEETFGPGRLYPTQSLLFFLNTTSGRPSPFRSVSVCHIAYRALCTGAFTKESSSVPDIWRSLSPVGN